VLCWKTGQLLDRFHLRRAAHLGDSFQELFPLHLAGLWGLLLRGGITIPEGWVQAWLAQPWREGATPSDVALLLSRRVLFEDSEDVPH